VTDDGQWVLQQTESGRFLNRALNAWTADLSRAMRWRSSYTANQWAVMYLANEPSVAAVSFGELLDEALAVLAAPW
jgi:hypothetical protein